MANEVEEGKIITVNLTGCKAGECFGRLARSSDTLAAAPLLRAAQSSSTERRSSEKRAQPWKRFLHAADN